MDLTAEEIVKFIHEGRKHPEDKTEESKTE